jgi:hypothetical protein
MMLAVFALTLFTSATLLFLVQPIIGKMLTPLLGGTPAVWNTCMVFFQVALLAGYAYSHATIAWLGVRRQALLHLVILLTPFIFFAINYFTLGRPLAVRRTVIDGNIYNLIPQLLLLLVASVGVPFFVISTSAPLLQKWFANTAHPAAKDPYFLYGASNLGSMLALLGYPTVVEPYLRVSVQTWAWMAAYAILVLLIGGCAAFLWLSPAAAPEPAPAPKTESASGAALALVGAARASEAIQPAGARAGVTRGRGKGRKRSDRYRRGHEPDEADLPKSAELTGEVTWPRRLRWVLLAAVPSSLMLGATTYITTDIAAIPLLWVLPLALYLLSFIIVFSKVPPVVHKISVLLLPLTLLLLIFLMFWTLSGFKPFSIVLALGPHLLALFVAAMVCHGELARDRPATKHLTEFFLWMSIGGVVGGLFNALVAPIIFDGIVEYQLAMVVACLLLPSLGLTTDSPFGRFADLALAGLCLTIGSVLIGLRLWDNNIEFGQLEHGMYVWLAVGVTLMLGLGLFAVYRFRGDEPEGPVYGVLVPLGLLLGAVALNILGLWVVYLMTPHNPGGVVMPQGMYLAVRLVLLLAGAGTAGFLGYLEWAGGRESAFKALTGLRAVRLMGILAGLFWAAAAFLLRFRGSGEPPQWGTFALVIPALVVTCGAVNAGALYLLYRLRVSDQRLQTWLDAALPLAVLIFVVGLVWGLYSQALIPSLEGFSELLAQSPRSVRVIITYGVPAVLCYTFVERSLRFGLSVAALLLAGAFTATLEDNAIFQKRSFFGVLRVEKSGSSYSEGPSHRLVHGTTLHGRQFLKLTEEDYEKNPQLRGSDTWPLTYYHRTGPIGHVMAAYNEPWRNLGVIGLGTGTMACYARRGQHITFYDIDPVVRQISYDSDRYFTFIQQAKERGAKLDLVMGDARLTMEKQRPSDDEKFHVLVVDAFSSDAIPIHLITYEALVMYLENMAEDGIVCFHVSNRYLNLRPVLANLAGKYTREKGPLVCYSMSDGEDEPGKAGSTWVVLARDRKYLARLKLADEWDRTKPADEWDRAVGLKEDFDPQRPSRQWDKMVKEALEPLGVQAARLGPRWSPLRVKPEVGEWTDDYAPLFRVFSW